MMLFFCAGAMWMLRIMEGKVWPGFHQGADRSKDDDAQADGIAEMLGGAGSRQEGHDGGTSVESDAAGGKCVALFF